MRSITKFLSIGVAAFLPLLCSISTVTAAERLPPSKTTSLLTLMRVGDGVVLGITYGFKRACGRVLDEKSERCDIAAADLIQNVEHERLAQKLTPFFDQHFSPDEIELMTQFYGSPEGKKLTELAGVAVYNKLNPEVPKPLPAMDRTAMQKVLNYQRSSVYLKYAQLAPEFADEAKRHLLPYLCELLELQGFSCVGLGLTGPAGR